MSAESHFPRVSFDGLEWRADCSCEWHSTYTDYKESAEEQWAKHAVSTMQRVIDRKSFVIRRSYA